MSIAAKLKEEFKAALPPAIFFAVVLHIVAIIHALLIKGTGIAAPTPLAVTMGALVMSKVVLVADKLPIINRYPHKPLIYNVLWKTVIYTLMSLVVRYLEHLIHYWRHAGSFTAGNRELFDKIVWPHFWAIQILLVVMILGYCTLRELVRVIGRQKVLEILFRPPPAKI